MKRPWAPRRPAEAVPAAAPRARSRVAVATPLSRALARARVSSPSRNARASLFPRLRPKFPPLEARLSMVNGKDVIIIVIVIVVLFVVVLVFIIVVVVVVFIFIVMVIVVIFPIGDEGVSDVFVDDLASKLVIVLFLLKWLFFLIVIVSNVV